MAQGKEQCHSSKFSPSRFSPQMALPFPHLPHCLAFRSQWGLHGGRSPPGPGALVAPQVAVPDVVQATADADILIFVVPHQFISKICAQLKGHLKANAIGISLIKVPGTPSCGWGCSYLLWGSGWAK